MRNVAEWELKKCIFKANDDFDYDVDQAFGKHMEVEFCLDGFTITDTETDECIETETINKTLSEYYDCEVTSVHMDDCDVVGVWICYR